jgi:helix-turn-helix protein
VSGECERCENHTLECTCCKVCSDHSFDCVCKLFKKSRFQVKNPLTLEERIKIKEGLDLNLTYREIAETIGRAKSTIIREARRLGEVSQYDPQKSQINFEYIQQIKRKNGRQNKKNN